MHRQGPGRGAAGAAATAARRRARRLSRGGHDDAAVGQANPPAADRAPRRPLAAAGAGGGLLLSQLELQVTEDVARRSRGARASLRGREDREDSPTKLTSEDAASTDANAREGAPCALFFFSLLASRRAPRAASPAAPRDEILSCEIASVLALRVSVRDSTMVRINDLFCTDRRDLSIIYRENDARGNLNRDNVSLGIVLG